MLLLHVPYSVKRLKSSFPPRKILLHLFEIPHLDFHFSFFPPSFWKIFGKKIPPPAERGGEETMKYSLVRTFQMLQSRWLIEIFLYFNEPDRINWQFVNRTIIWLIKQQNSKIIKIVRIWLVWLKFYSSTKFDYRNS